MSDIVEGIKTLEKCLFGVFFAAFRQISRTAVVFLLLTLSNFV